MSNIRVTYSGLIALAIGLTSVVTGMIFTLIVTRRLTPEEFGIWSVIGSMITYFLIAEPIISFWSTRQIARGEDVGRTSITSSLLFSFGTIPLYILLSYLVSKISNQDFHLMLLSCVLLPVTFLSQTLTGINLGHKPHATSYGLLAFEILKIPVGLYLVYFLNMGVEGAIITTTIAYILKILVQLYFAKNILRQKFNLSTIKRWMRLSWIPLYSYSSHIVSIIDVVLFSIITSSVRGVAYYSASNTVAAIIANAGLISQAVYPKLLSKGSSDHASENFTRLLYFAIPLLGITMIFSKPALFALNPVYADTSIITIIIALRTFLYILTSFFYQVLLGIETVDVDDNPRFMKLLKSKIFLIPSLQNIQYCTHVITVVVVITSLYTYGTSLLDLVKWWAVIGLVIQIPFFIFSIISTGKYVKMSFSIVSMIKYGGSTALFYIAFLLTSKSLIDYKRSIYDFLPGVMLQLAICLGVYMLSTVIIDKKTRVLFESIISELKGKS